MHADVDVPGSRLKAREGAAKARTVPLAEVGGAREPSEQERCPNGSSTDSRTEFLPIWRRCVARTGRVA
ncbi:MAG: hypothetical protein K8S98_07080 [Planctomycetes bacterium]|nr:hypothetical protein [Planctomycetota bacterium]